MSYTYDYPMQTVTADAVVVYEEKVLLIKRNIEPFKGCYALPVQKLILKQVLQYVITLVLFYLIVDKGGLYDILRKR